MNSPGVESCSATNKRSFICFSSSGVKTGRPRTSKVTERPGCGKRLPVNSVESLDINRH